MATNTPKRGVGRPRKSPTSSEYYTPYQQKFSLKKRWIALIAVVAIVLFGFIGNMCGLFSGFTSGSLTSISVNEVSNSAPINVLEQSKQAIMVLPSDNLLQRFNSLSTTESMGKTLYIRYYQKFLLSDGTNQQIINSIQKSFSDRGYPLVNLEQTLKSLENQSLLDAADGVAKDAKTLLLSTARPDIIIEFDYEIKTTVQSRESITHALSYNISLLDAFTNKSIGSISDANVKGYKATDTPAVALKGAIESNASDLSKQIKSYFKDLLTYGREVTFTVAVASGAGVTLQDIYNSDGDTYADWIREWVKTNAKRGAATMQRNTRSEIYFVNVRIENLQSDGTQFNAYDFADLFRKEFYRTFKIQALNNTQGLAGAQLLIK